MANTTRCQPKKGKKNRKFGRGTRKMQRSRFGSYANWFAYAAERRRKRMATRKARLARRRAKKESGT